jgi:hypothetical protein
MSSDNSKGSLRSKDPALLAIMSFRRRRAILQAPGTD